MGIAIKYSFLTYKWLLQVQMQLHLLPHLYLF